MLVQRRDRGWGRPVSGVSEPSLVMPSELVWVELDKTRRRRRQSTIP